MLACTSCDLVVSIPVTDDESTRSVLGTFFSTHADHATWIDVSGAGAALPRPRSGSDVRGEG